MPPVPVITYAECVRALGKLGYVQVRQEGSHVRFKGPSGKGVTVPKHSEIARGMLRNIIREIGISVDAFTALL
jgi:predicted RNA binding protein YcfA (HicA-like mRNA interferase family)